MSIYLYNPFMPSIDFASRIARGGGGGDGGGGGSDNAPSRVSVAPEPTRQATKNKALDVAADLNKQYANQNVNYTRGYDAKTGEVVVVNVPQGSDNNSQPTTRKPTFRDRPASKKPTPTPTPTPEPEQPTPEVPSSEMPGPVFTPQQPEDLPDALPTSAAEDQVVIDVQKPTYTPVESVRSNITAPTDDLEATSTFSRPLASAGTSAVPDQVTVRPQYTGTTMRNLTTPSQGIQSVQQVVYKNRRGQTLNVTEMNGAPLTYVPPGYEPAARMNQMIEAERTLELPTETFTQAPPVGFAEAVGPVVGQIAGSMFSEGGSVQDAQLDGMYRMATKFLGYTGPKTREALAAFRNSSPAVAAKMQSYAKGMAKGGMVRKGFAEGGVTGLPFGLSSLASSAIASSPNLTNTATSTSGAAKGAISTTFMPDPNTPDGSTITDPMTGETLYKRNGQWLTKEQLDAQVAQENYARDKAAIEFQDNLVDMQREAITQTMQPRQATVQPMMPDAADFIAPTAGQTAPVSPMAEAATVGSVELAQQQQATQAALMQPTTVAPQVQQVTDATQAAQGQVSPEAQVTAATQAETAVSGLQAAQGTGILMDNPVQREIQAGELISGVADAEKAAAFNEQIQAATATPSEKATVQGQLEQLMQQFEGGNVPAWAAGSMRAATATLAARGLGASSLAGQAVIQATMEAALPIAQIDAQTFAQFESQNLSNRQQRAMLAAQQRAQFLGIEFDQAFQARVANSARIGDIANMNFTAEQQVALENSRIANTVNLQNLSNRQAKVMAEAAALSQLDMANLSNRQQAAVQNAQNFMQMDLTNLSNEQQTTMFKAQQNIQALFTDQAAENAAAQFNATSENQTNQFFATLAAQTSQFNAAQTNALEQFNVDSVNSLRQFNSEMQQQRDLFNAQNGLVVAQANAQWRQQIATTNNAAINESNRIFAQTMNEISANNMDRIWQRERDIMSFAVQTANSNADRATEILKQKMANEGALAVADAEKSSALAQAGGSLVADIAKGFVGKVFGF